MTSTDDYFTLDEAIRESGLDELALFERFLTYDLRPSVYFTTRVPARLVPKGKGDWVNPEVFYLRGLWDLTIGNKSQLLNGSESLIIARRDGLRHRMAVSPNPSGYIFVQQDRREKGESGQLHKVDFCRLLDGRRLTDGEQHPAIDLPAGAHIVIRKCELRALLDAQATQEAKLSPEPADPQRRLALLRQLGGKATRLRTGEVTLSGIGALVAHEVADNRPRSSAKTVRSDLRIAVNAEHADKREGTV